MAGLMSEPLVSIIIPCFNAERTLRESIQSALTQSFSSREVVVVDDGSTDGSRAILESFGREIRWIPKDHAGGSAARNHGIQMARGSLFQFLDADDILYPDKLARQVPLMQSGAHDVVSCNGVLRNGDVEDRKELALHGDPDDPLVFLLSGRMQTLAPLHRRDILERVGGFRKELPCAQEFDLHLRIAAAGGSFFHLPEFLYEVRVQAGSVSSDYGRVLDQYEKVLMPVYETLEKNGTLTVARCLAMAQFLANGARVCLRLGKTELGLHYFELAKAMDPNGVLAVYSPAVRPWRGILGPVLLEKMVTLKRRLMGRN